MIPFTHFACTRSFCGLPWALTSCHEPRLVVDYRSLQRDHVALATASTIPGPRVSPAETLEATSYSFISRLLRPLNSIHSSAQLAKLKTQNITRKHKFRRLVADPRSTFHCPPVCYLFLSRCPIPTTPICRPSFFGDSPTRSVRGPVSLTSRRWRQSFVNIASYSRATRVFWGLESGASPEDI